MKQKIVYVVDSIFEPGSTHLLRALVRSNATKNLETVVISLNCGPSDAPENQIVFETAKFQLLPKTRFLAERILLLRKLITATNPNIVHCWGIDSAFATQIACLNLPVKNVVTVLEKRNIDYELFSRLAFWSNQTKIIANHASTRNYLADHQIQCHQIIPSLTIESGTNPVDREKARTDLLSLLNLHSQPDVYIAGTVGRLEPKYRLKDLVWAIDLICRVRQDVHLVILGQGDQRPIRNYLSKLECDNNVHFIEPNRCSINLIAGIDMFWNSQREFAAPPGLVFAMQNAIPVISVLCEETSDLVLPLQTGLATNLGSRDEFARWTKYLIEIPGAAPRLGMQGKQHVENMLITKTMVDGYQKLYADL